MHENNERSIEEKKLDILEETYEIIKKEIEAQRIDANEFFRRRILTEIIANRRAARAELEKPEYEGKTMDDIEALATSTDADPKYIALWEQLLAAIAKDIQQRYPSFFAGNTPRAKAAKNGELVKLDHVSNFSLQQMQTALTPDCIFKLPGNSNEFTFSKNGQLNTLPFETGNKELLQLTKLHTGFLMFVLEVVQQQADDDSDSEQFTFYIKEACQKCHFDPRAFSEKREKGTSLPELQKAKLLSIIAQFDPYIGKAADGVFYRVLSLQAYDPETETITISAPYIKRQYDIARAKALGHSPLNRLFHASVVSTKNQAALELANRLLSGLKRLGLKQRRYEASCELLVTDCPQLREQLKQIQDSGKENWRQQYNTHLKRVFEAAHRLILDESDAPFYYKNFTIGPKNQRGQLQTPTVTTLRSRKICITHSGKNEGYDPG